MTPKTTTISDGIKQFLLHAPSKQALGRYRKALADANEAWDKVTNAQFALQEAEKELLGSVFSQMTDIEHKGILYNHLPREIKIGNKIYR